MYRWKYLIIVVLPILLGTIAAAQIQFSVPMRRVGLSETSEDGRRFPGYPLPTRAVQKQIRPARQVSDRTHHLPDGVNTYRIAGRNYLSEVRALAVDPGDQSIVFIAVNVGETDENRHCVLAKYSSVGDTLWVRRVNLSDTDGHPSRNFNDPAGLFIDTEGNIFVGFQLNATLVKFDRFGRQQWIVRDTSMRAGALMAAAPDGNVIFSKDEWHRQDTIPIPWSYYHAISYDRKGRQQWSTNFHVTGNNIERIIKVLPDNSVYLIGEYYDGYGTRRPYIAHLAANGDVLWTRSDSLVSEHSPLMAATDRAGNLFISIDRDGKGSIHVYTADGTLRNAIPTPPTDHATMVQLATDSSGGILLTLRQGDWFSWQIILYRYDTSGRQSWATTIETGQNGNPVPQDLSVTAGGEIFTTIYMPDSVGATVISKFSALGNRLWSTRLDAGTSDSPGSSSLLTITPHRMVVARTQASSSQVMVYVLNTGEGSIEWQGAYNGGETSQTNLASLLSRDDGALDLSCGSSPSYGADRILHYSGNGTLVRTDSIPATDLVPYPGKGFITHLDGKPVLIRDDGTIAWQTAIADTSGSLFVETVNVAADGDVLAAGSYNLPASCNCLHSALFVTKLSPDGSIRWVIRSKLGIPYTIFSGDSGAIFVIGGSSNMHTEWHLFVRRFDEQGTERYDANVGYRRDSYMTCYGRDGYNNVYVGFTGSDFLMGPSSLGTFLAIIDPSGMYSIGQHSATAESAPVGVAAANSHDFYILSRTEGDAIGKVLVEGFPPSGVGWHAVYFEQDDCEDYPFSISFTRDSNLAVFGLTFAAGNYQSAFRLIYDRRGHLLSKTYADYYSDNFVGINSLTYRNGHLGVVGTSWDNGPILTILQYTVPPDDQADSQLPGAVNDGRLAEHFSLSQNFPNPFNPTTDIGFRVADIGRSGGRSLLGGQVVTLKIYNVLGQEVATLVNEVKPAGTYSVRWDAAGMPTGMYFYKLTVGRFVEVKKMVLMR